MGDYLAAKELEERNRKLIEDMAQKDADRAEALEWVLSTMALIHEHSPSVNKKGLKRIENTIVKALTDD